MLLLAFETSCDDTSVAIMRDDQCIALSTRTQMEHSATGGVVPEVAARSHANAIFPCIEDALTQAGISLDQIDGIACTDHPGLLPSLLTGMTVAKTLSLTLKKPLYWIDHIEGHIFANFLDRDPREILFPNIVLTVSGGHTELYLWKSLYEKSLIGQTLDDAAGEAFDKVSKMMGMGFPGGATIARLAAEYVGEFQGIFPEVLLDRDSLDFSFSGLKSAVKREVDKRITNYELRITNEKGVEIPGNPPVKGRRGVGMEKEALKLLETPLSGAIGAKRSSAELARGGCETRPHLTLEDIRQIAYEFEETVVRILTKKLMLAAERYGVEMVTLAGGVSCNVKLKDRITAAAKKKSLKFVAPMKNLYSQDNAAMIGIRGWYEVQKGK